MTAPLTQDVLALLDDRFWKRFWSKVEKTDGCWLWTGSVGGHGYGQINVAGQPRTVHRLMLEHIEGEVLGPGEMACHHCDVRRCVHPEHLYRGDARTNQLDAQERGRAYVKPRKTHCHRGHPLSEYKDRQICWPCLRERTRQYRAKAKERAA
jgi:hypothetical protein